MFPTTFDAQTPKANSNQNTVTGSSSSRAGSSSKKHFSDHGTRSFPEPRSLTMRSCRSPVSDQAADSFPSSREQVGGKGMFLQRMKKADLPVPPFECVTAQVMNALEQQPLDTRLLDRYFPGVVYDPEAEISLTNIREYLNSLPPSEQTKRNNWLVGLAEFIVSDDYYEQVKDSEAARQIRGLRHELDRLYISQPVIVRSSGINEDNYGDAQAGKYLSLVQGNEDILRTCLKVMASGYRSEVCPEGIPQPMALIIQQCIHCRCGGVAMSYKSFDDDTISVEFTPGQPRGAVAGQSGNTPHRIDIARKGRKRADSYQYFPGTISSQFTLHSNNNGYSEKRMDVVDVQANDGGQLISDEMVSKLRKLVKKLEKLLFCPVDVEFAIDHWDRLFLLQVRPVTRLSGDMVFAMPIPKETLAIGEGISEGFCTGPLWLARKPEAVTMPQGAIVVAHHAEDWMLVPEFLKRVGGFVLAEAGFNDHVAILMKQKKITLMRAGGQYSALFAQDGQQATLACARFKNKPGAFIVAGDIAETLANYRSLTSAVSDALTTKPVPSREDLSPPEGTFDRVASGFQWLTDQNARLLAFFASGGGLDCLENPVKLSMSPQRSEILAENKYNLKRLLYGAEVLLEGYRAFLLLSGDSSSPWIKPLLAELPQLNKRFKTLKKTIRSMLETIRLPLKADVEGPLSTVTFPEWLDACHQLKSCLQALNPEKAEKIRSVHELIFALHRRFVSALAKVTLASGQGRQSSSGSIKYVDCAVSGNPNEKMPLLKPSCKVLIEKLGCSGTVIIADGVLIVNLKLGSHLCLIELFENAEGGKGRTLRLKFSDQFYKDDGIDSAAKLKRMWLLVQLLKVLELDKDADSMKLRCNAVVGEIIVECTRMKTTKTMQDAVEKLLTVLCGMCDLDCKMLHIDLFESNQWNFSLLAQRLNGDITAEADRFAFQHCLFAMYYKKRIHYTPDCFKLLPSHHRQFIHYAKRFEECRDKESRDKESRDKESRDKESRDKTEDNFREILMSNEITEQTRKELLHHLLYLDAQRTAPLIEDVYPDLRHQCYVLKPFSYSYRLSFDVPPGQSLADNREKITKALLKHGLQYASQQLRNDKELILTIIAARPKCLEFASEKLKNSKKVVMTAINQHGFYLQYAGPKIKDNEEVVKAAITDYPEALGYASERIRSDKNIIQMVIDKHIDHLYYASERVLNDRKYLLDLIAHNSRAFISVAHNLKRDMDFIRSAIHRNRGVVKHVDEESLEKYYSSEFAGS
ncbi:DUF4116 domain-containing protein [Endozoicomonas sp. ALB032]|uniref:DUF4116 domain-containing protein n=1 Tax=Endozoicomonas sp. ALB032 TaxID=3403082 RepID=UPI003BB7E853